MQEQQLTSLLESVLGQFGLELESLDSVPAGKRRLLRVTVDGDGPQGRGPLLDDIAAATRAISDALDESPAVGQQAYTLEVSSRGTSRPLTEPKHWRRNTGRLVKVVRHDADPVEGRIVSSDDETVTLTVVTNAKRHETAQVEVAYSEISKALVQVELTSIDEGNN